MVQKPLQVELSWYLLARARRKLPLLSSQLMSSSRESHQSSGYVYKPQVRLSKKGCHCKLQLSEGVAWYRECCCRQWSPGLTPGSQDMLWLEKLHNPKGTWWLSLSQTAFFSFFYLVPVFLILKSLILKLWFKLSWCSWRRMNQSKTVPLRVLRLQGGQWSN